MTASSCELRGVSVGSRGTTEGRTGRGNVNENYPEQPGLIVEGEPNATPDNDRLQINEKASQPPAQTIQATLP